MLMFFKRAEKIISGLFEKRVGLLFWSGGFLAVIFLRCFIDHFLAVASPISLPELVVMYIHNFYFFSISLILIWFFLSFIFQIKPQNLSGVLVIFLLLIIISPLIEIIKNGGEIYWSFYLLSSPADLAKQYLTVFGNLPPAIVYFGTKIVFIGGVIFSFILILVRERSYFKSFFGSIFIYSILFFMGAFPTFFFYGWTFLAGGKISEIQSFNIMQFFGAPGKIFGVSFQSFKYMLAYRLDFVYYILLVILLAIFFYLADKKKFWAVVKNARLPQIFYHSGLFFIGLGLGFLNYPENFRLEFFSILSAIVLLLSVWFSWLASVVVNDLDDFEIDKISNPERPLPQKVFTSKEYGQLGIVFFLLALLGAVSVGLVFAAVLLVYQIIAWFYSAEPFRLKKFPLVATLASSLALITILFLGYILASDNQTIYTLSPNIIFLILITFTLSLPIKDFKDIAGDKRFSVWTLPVILGEKKGRILVAINVFISHILSVFFLNELRLFWWAMLFGTFNFLVITSPKIKPRQLFWPVLGLVFVYGLILVKIVFL